MAKSLSSCREDAFVLNGLLRGLSVLHAGNGPDARDGVAALVEVALERADQLAHDLDALDAPRGTSAVVSVVRVGPDARVPGVRSRGTCQ